MDREDVQQIAFALDVVGELGGARRLLLPVFEKGSKQQFQEAQLQPVDALILDELGGAQALAISRCTARRLPAAPRLAAKRGSPQSLRRRDRSDCDRRSSWADRGWCCKAADWGWRAAGLRAMKLAPAFSATQSTTALRSVVSPQPQLRLERTPYRLMASPAARPRFEPRRLVGTLGANDEACRRQAGPRSRIDSSVITERQFRCRARIRLRTNRWPRKTVSSDNRKLAQRDPDLLAAALLRIECRAAASAAAWASVSESAIWGGA